MNRNIVLVNKKVSYTRAQFHIGGKKHIMARIKMKDRSMRR